MDFYHYFPSVATVCTADQFVGRDDGPLEQQKQDSHVCRNRTFRLILRKKSESLHCLISM